MKMVPTTWDETVYIDGYPGKYAVIARRNGSHWYITGISNADKALDLKLDLPMLTKGSTVDLYSDAPGKELKMEKMKIKDPSKVKITLHPAHGFVIMSE